MHTKTRSWSNAVSDASTALQAEVSVADELQPVQQIQNADNDVPNPLDGSVARLRHLAKVYLEARRRAVRTRLDYLILVPTLRCNLACTYCQVSRAARNARGYDWSPPTLYAVRRLVRTLQAGPVKIEFQGGEPTLRPDLIQAVIDAVPQGVDAEFVICTNLQELDPATMSLLDRPDVSISTSLDGPVAIHERQRTIDARTTSSFLENLDFIIGRYGPGKVSALPTIDPINPPDPDELIETFVGRDMPSIYLRPINFQGFARKRHAGSRETGEAWQDYHERFIRRLIEVNYADRSRVLEETYFSLILRRIFRPGHDRHVDLRNPNPMGRDYIVVDHDGTVYPTDEARMLSRAGVIDLAIGDVFDGWDTPARDALDAASRNDDDPHCLRCRHQPYCGRDIVDDLSRYGTIDLPRTDTEFCRRHMALFDLAHLLIVSQDEAVRYSLGRWLGLSGPLPDMERSA